MGEEDDAFPGQFHDSASAWRQSIPKQEQAEPKLSRSFLCFGMQFGGEDLRMSATENANTPSILDLINRTLELPTLPDVLVKLNEVMDDPESSAEEVAQVISMDPSVSANILRIVNSAYFGLQVRVGSINLAVSIMGFKMTKKVALKAAIFSVFAKNKGSKISDFDPNLFWKHSIYTGTLARALGKKSEIFSGHHPEDLYICGLLHDIGKIILLENATEAFSDVVASAKTTGRSLLELEQEILGYTHADVGSVLAIKWYLPEDLTIAIRYHHNPDRDPFHKSLSSLISLSDQIAGVQGRGSFDWKEYEPPSPSLFEAVALTPEDVDEVCADLGQDGESSDQWL